MAHSNGTSMAPRNNCGITLVETLVVVAIIGILLAVVFPAIQVARGSSRANACKNNLKQVCLAVLQHSTSNAGRLPASWLAVRDKDGKPVATAEYDFHRTSFSWRASILPLIGEQSLYDRLDLQSTPISDDNAALT